MNEIEKLVYLCFNPSQYEIDVNVEDSINAKSIVDLPIFKELSEYYPLVKKIICTKQLDVNILSSEDIKEYQEDIQTIDSILTILKTPVQNSNVITDENKLDIITYKTCALAACVVTFPLYKELIQYYPVTFKFLTTKRGLNNIPLDELNQLNAEIGAIKDITQILFDTTSIELTEAVLYALN